MNRVVAVARPWVLGALLVASGCGDDEAKGPAAPELQRFVAVDMATMQETDLLTPVDGGIPAVSPLLPLKVVFNKLLDGKKLESDMGPGADVATATWMGAPTGAPAVPLLVSYNPNGWLPGKPDASAKFERKPHAGPSILITGAMGLPSGAQLVIRLDKAKVTDKKGNAYVGPETLSVQTQPFAAALNIDETMGVAADHHLEVVFSNLPAMGVEQHVRLTSGGAAVMAEIKPAMAGPAVTIEPMGGWVTGRTYTVTVAKAAADRFGVALGMDFSQTFTVGAGGNADAGGADGGGADGGGGADAPRDGTGFMGGDAALDTNLLDAIGGDVSLDLATD